MSPTLPAHLASLMEAGAYPHPVRQIRLIETHLAWVLLTGEFAYKIKRPVRYPFVDQRSQEKRANLCREELRLNRRFAPHLYLSVEKIVMTEGGARIAADGAAIECAVRMREFDTADQLDRLLENGRIEPCELEQFGRSLARIHCGLPVARESQRWGWPSIVRHTMRENLEECLQAMPAFGEEQDLGAIRDGLMARLDTLSALMTLRIAEGAVRECHGDLHTRNIVRLGGVLVAYDCMEFEPAFRWIDVAEDISFLLADLEAGGNTAHAHAFLSGFLAQSGDYAACKLLGLYKAHHAMVRAKVIALTASGIDSARLPSITARLMPYVDTARKALSRKSPALILMSGLPGSGKTTLARKLAASLEALHLRSDVERKRMAGLGENARSDSKPGAGLYSSDASERTYARLATCAHDAVSGGYTAIVDATFARRIERRRFRELADRLGVELSVIHCHAPLEILRQRVSHRQLSGKDASEADPGVLEWQSDHAEPIRADEGFEVLEVDTAREESSPSLAALVSACTKDRRSLSAGQA